MPTIYKLAGMLAFTLALTGCAKELEQLNRDLAAANATMANQRAASLAQAQRADTMALPETQTGKEKPTQLIAPTDTRTREAMDSALPTIKKVLEIHSCIKTNDGALQLNYLAVPGVDIRNYYLEKFPNHPGYMQYHDRNKCVSLRTIDNWTMPALNALKFRSVYFAEDSGETVNFEYLMKKMDDGSWRLQSYRSWR